MRLPPRQPTAEADLMVPFQLAKTKTISDDDIYISRVALRVNIRSSQVDVQSGLAYAAGGMPPLPPLSPMQWRTGKLQNTSVSTMPDGGLHGFSNFPSPFPPIETPPPLDQNENITNGKSDNGYEDMESSSKELPTEPSVNTEEVAERIVPQPPSNTEPSVNTVEDAERIVPQPPSDTEPSVHTEKAAERIVPQPPSDTEPSVHTEKAAERIVPQPPSDKERPPYVFPTEREIIRPSSTSSH